MALGRLTQLVRVPDLHSGCRRFESVTAHQFCAALPRKTGELIGRGALRPGERRTENGERGARQAGDKEGVGRRWEVYPAGLTRRCTKNHKDTFADWSRLGAGCRRLTASLFYHKEHKGPQRAQRNLADWLIGRCGALPHAPAGGRARKRALENGACRPGGPNLPRPQRTENRAPDKRATGGAHRRKPSLQASKLPSFHLPLHPRHVCDVPHRRRGRTNRMYRTYRTATDAACTAARPSRACRAFCSLFTVLCSLGRVSAP